MDSTDEAQMDTSAAQTYGTNDSKINITMDESPPPYDSLFGKVKSAKTTSSGGVDFVKKFVVIIAGSVLCTVCSVILLAIPVADMVIGALYLDDCPAERYIPIYLIVMGAFLMFQTLLRLAWGCCCKKDQNEDEEQSSKENTNPLVTLISCFLFAWFIAGNVWVYRLHGHWSSDESAPNYCHPTLYYYAFWIITATYILLGAMCIGCCLMLAIVAVVA